MQKAEKTALMVFDMQVDFCQPQGVYHRLGGFNLSGIKEITPPIQKVMEVARAARIPIIGTKFTVFAGLNAKAIGLGHLSELRPFLMQEGFRQNSPGQKIIPELPRPNYELEKTRFSAFCSTLLEALLRALKIERLILTGIATNGAVEATAGDAIMRDMQTTTLRDCTASFSPTLHEASLASLGRVCAAEEWLTELSAEN